MAARLSIFHKGLIVILSPILLETAIVFSLSSILAKIDEQQLVETYFRETSSSVIRMSSLSFDACMYLFAMSMPRSPVPKSYFDEKIVELKKQTDRVLNLMSRDVVFRPIFTDVVKVEYRVIELFEGLGETIGSDASEQEKLAQAGGTVKEVVTMLGDTADKIEQFSEQNNKRIDNSSAFISRLRRDHSNLLILAFILNVVLSIILIVYFQRSIIRRLAQIHKNTLLLKEGKELPPTLEGVDEISVLDQSFHTMQLALKKTRRKEEMFFENASDVICVLNKNNQFVKLNSAAQKSWGLAVGTVLGEQVETIFSSDDRAQALEQLDSCRKSGNAKFFECKVLRNKTDAIEFTWSAYYEPVEEQLYCVAHDISLRKQIERARERYISIVSHDLKKPIASIAESFATVAETNNLPEKASGKIGAVKSNVGRLLSLVNELSQRKSMGDSDDTLSIDKVNMASLLERAANDIEGFARSKKVSVICAPLQAEIEADEGRLMQVLVNLLSNAIKFSNENAEVFLRAKDAGEEIEIEIADNGRGVPEHKQAAIFGKYKQVDDADGKRSAGTGLGLPICQQIVEQHFGTIGVRSKPDEGSIFWLRIPKVYRLDQTPKENETDSQEAEAGRLPALPDFKAQTAGRGFGLQNVKLIQKGVILVGIPLLFEIALAGMLTYFFLQSENLARTEIVERRIVNTSNQLTFCYREMGIALLSPSTDSAVYRAFEKNLKKTVMLAKQLRSLVKNDKERSRRVSFIITKIKACNYSLTDCYATRQAAQGGVSNPSVELGIVYKMMKPLGSLTREMQDLIFEATKRQSRTPEQQRHLRQAQDNLLYGGLTVNIVLGLLLARLFSNDIRKRLEQVAQNTRLLAEEKALTPALGGTDEIAVLDAAFHEAAAELSEARKRERTLFDNSNQVICALSPALTMTGVNPAASRLWGYSREELLKTPLLDIVIEEDREETRRNLSLGSTPENAGGSLASNTGSVGFGPDRNTHSAAFENRILAKDGKVFDTLWSATHVAEENEVFCMAHDITRQKEADRLRNEFLSIISHDLRTPLSGILVTTAMLEEGGYGLLPAAAVERLSSVTSDVNRLLELINDLLDIEKLEAGMMSLAYESVKLKELSSELTEKCKKMLEEKQISLTVELEDSAIFVDKDRFTQAMANLLNNSIERSKSGSSIDLLADKNSESFSLIIRDHAPILDKRSRESIFDRFAMSGSAHDASRLSSLAIPLSKSIISVHGGTVELVPPPRSATGSTGNDFIIQLPSTRMV